MNQTTEWLKLVHEFTEDVKAAHERAKNEQLDRRINERITAAMMQAERQEIDRRGEKIMALELANAAKDAKIAQLRETVKVLGENMCELAKRALPSKDRNITILNANLESLQDRCREKDGKIQELIDRCNRRQDEIEALRQRLADSENTVAQLRAARDKREGKSFRATGAIVADSDGWIECRYLPINQWCDVKRADGTTDRVCRPEVRGVQQAAEITHYRPVKKEAQPKQDDDWIEWKGGQRPIESHIHVSCKLQDGRTITGVAGGFHWDINNSWGGPIIAYRVAK